uniref:Uncharacterized protein n=1 Tax=Vespula pensylvanica TaxID=30213 RepID=A0A834UD48_VESPE|nr:hypothetical protein H0235_004672 [Vespula pensylvanica]
MAHFYDSLSVYPLEFVAYHAINVYYSRKGSLPGSTVAMGKEHAGCWMLDAACHKPNIMAVPGVPCQIHYPILRSLLLAGLTSTIFRDS